MSAGPMNLVTEAPTLPAPKTPEREALVLRAATRRETQAMPTLNELPAKPTRNA